MTIIHSTKLYPLLSVVLYFAGSISYFGVVAVLAHNISIYNDSGQYGDLVHNWPWIVLALVLMIVLSMLSVAETQVRLYPDRIERGVRLGMRKKLKTRQVILAENIRSLDIEQRPDLHFKLVLKSQSGEEILLASHPNRQPLIRCLNAKLENENENWQQYKMLGAECREQRARSGE